MLKQEANKQASFGLQKGEKPERPLLRPKSINHASFVFQKDKIVPPCVSKLRLALMLVL